MLKSFVRRVLFVSAAAMLPLGSSVWAQSTASFACSLMGDGSRGQKAIEPNGRSRDLPVALDNCVGTKAATGALTACAVDALGRRGCREFLGGKPVEAFSLTHGNLGQGGFAAVMRLLTGSTGTTLAQSRDSSDSVLPDGPVLFSDKPLLIKLNGIPGPAEPIAVELKRGSLEGTVVDKQSGLKPGATLQWPVLEEGSRYCWTLSMPSRSLTPNCFEVTSRGTATRAKKVLADFGRDARAGRSGRAALQAAWLLEHGYDFDARLVLNELKPAEP